MRSKLLVLCLHITVFAADYSEQIAKKNRYIDVYKDANIGKCDKCQQPNAFDVDVLNQKVSEANKSIKNFGITMPKISDDAKKKALEIKQTVNSELGQKNIDSMKSTILNDTIYNYKGQETDPWHKSFQNTGISSIENMPEYKSQHKPALLAPREKLFLVVSSTMPDLTVREYLRTISTFAPNDITVIMRGFVGGMDKMRPTVEYVKRVTDDGRLGSIDVHPDIVKTYDIKKVPALLYIKDFDPVNDNNNGITVKGREYFVVYGAVGLEGAVQKIKEAYPTKGISKILAKLRGEGAGFYGRNR